MRPRFSVVVPTFNRPQPLSLLLEALAGQHYPREDFEVIVVDDGGREPLDELSLRFRDRLMLEIIRQPHGGCGPARQAGIDRSRGHYLAFTDDDCQPAPDWLSRLAEALEAHPGCGVGGLTQNGLKRNVFAETTQFIVNLLVEHGRRSPGFISYCPTTNAAFPSEAFRLAGGLRRTWAISGGEDRDLCARWIAAGFSIWYEPSAVVLHAHDLTARAFLKQHFHYGRGAWAYHHSELRQPYERFSYYYGLLVQAFRHYAPGRAIGISAAAVAAQAAAAAGFLFEAAARRSRTR